MNPTKLSNELIWNTVQEPRPPAALPPSHMLLLSALDKGWTIARTELVPSWDQHGFIYLVTLQHPGTCDSQQLILSRGSVTDDLLHLAELKAATSHPNSMPFLWHG